MRGRAKSSDSKWALAVLGLALACNGGSDDDDENEGGPSAAGTPQELCEQKCSLQIAAGCENTPDNYLESCTALCLAKYENFPDCADQIRPLDVCSVERVTYGCDSGTVTSTPMGTCANEALQCVSCTGEFLNCL